jgi:WD40 repeat protein
MSTYADGPILAMRPEQHLQVVSIALSPEGTQLATAGWDHEPRSAGAEGLWRENPDHSVCLWDVATGRLVHSMLGHHAGIVSMAFSPDGGTIASGGDTTVKLWDTRTGRLARTFAADHRVHAVAYAPDGHSVACARGDLVKVWDTQTGQSLRRLEPSEGEILCSVAISPDGRLLAAGTIFGIKGPAGDVILWDLETGRLVHRLTGNSGGVGSVAFSQDGSILVSTGGGGEAAGQFSVGLSLWEAETGRLLRTLPRTTRMMGLLGFAADGRVAVSSGEMVQFWDTDTGFLQTSSIPGTPGLFLPVTLSANAKVLAGVFAHDGTVKVWRFGGAGGPSPAEMRSTDCS